MENIRPIRNETDYDWALAEIAVYFENQPAPGSPEAERFEVLAELIEGYENKYWRIDAPDPVDAIAYALEARQLKQSDLAEILGSRSRASEIMNRKRPLTLDMIQRLHDRLSIPSDVLIQPYHLAGEESSAHAVNVR